MNEIERSEGFRVTSPDGPVGMVEEVVYGADHLPSALIVSAGLFERRRFLVAAEDVLDASPERGTLVLSPSWQSSAVDVSSEPRLVA